MVCSGQLIFKKECTRSPVGEGRTAVRPYKGYRI